MRVYLQAVSLLFGAVLFAGGTSSAHSQISLPGFGQKNSVSNDQKVNALLHQHLPLDLDANSAYPTVANEDLLGGPFQGRVLHITLDTLTKPLPPGDYVLPMTFFCSEYSIHRPGAGTAYVLAPAKGTAARAISTLLWRGSLAGYKPQELQSVSWAIQGSVPYDKMPANYKRLVDELIPDMKNQVNGQAFADIEDGFQGKVNRFTRAASGKMTDGLSKVTGGRGKVDLKVDVELNESLQRLGRLGRVALDGENISSIVQAANLTDAQREQALYAGQGTQSPPLQAVNGPWSVIVPGTAYMRYLVHGGNLHGDNIMQIRILSPGLSASLTGNGSRTSEPHLVLAQYPQSTTAAPPLVKLLNGSVDQNALSQCHASDPAAHMCTIRSMSFQGHMEYPTGESQISISVPTDPLSSTPPSRTMCLAKVQYEPTVVLRQKKDHPHPTKALGLCILLAVVQDVNGSCKGAPSFSLPPNQQVDWVQTYQTNNDPSCSTDNPHKDVCLQRDGKDVKQYGPMYRSDRESNPGDTRSLYTSANKKDFPAWRSKLATFGDLQLLFRDIPTRWLPAQDVCDLKKSPDQPGCSWIWSTAVDPGTKDYIDSTIPAGYSPTHGLLDNDLRLVRYATDANDPDHFNYTPLFRLHYRLQVNWITRTVQVDPLEVIGGVWMKDQGTEEYKLPRPLNNGGLIQINQIEPIGRAGACRVPDKNNLGDPPTDLSPFPYPSK